MAAYGKMFTPARTPWLLGLLFFSLMAVYPLADAPRYIQDSAGFHFDPFSKIHAARNLVLTGEASRSYDDWTPHVHSPVYTLAQWGVFKLFGVGLWQIRLVTMAGISLCLGVLFTMLRKEYGQTAAWLGASLFAFNNVIYFSGRSGLIEPMMMGLGALTIAAAAQLADEKTASVKWALLAGVLAGLTLCTKMIGLPFALAPLLYLMFHRMPLRFSWLYFMLGMILVMAFFHGGVWVMHHEDVLREASFWKSKHESRSFWKNFIYQPLFIKLFYQDIVLVGGLLAYPFLADRFRKEKRQAPITHMMGLVLVLGVMSLSGLVYRPFRYHIPLLFPACFLTAAGLHWIWGHARTKVEWPKQGGIFWLGSLVAWIYIYNFGYLVFNEDAAWMPAKNLLQRFGLACILALLTLFIIWALMKIPRSAARTWAARAVVLLLCAQHFKDNLVLIGDWADKPRYSIQEFSDWLKTDLKDATISGLSPNFSLIRNTHYGLRWEQTGINVPSIQVGNWTHLVLPYRWKTHENFEALLGDDFRNAVLLGEYPIINYGHALLAKNLFPLTATFHRSDSTLQIFNQDKHTAQKVIGLSWNAEQERILFAADWWAAPRQPIDLKRGDSFFLGEQGLFSEFIWTSIEEGGFTCSKTGIRRHPHGTGSAALDFKGKKSGEVYGSFSRPAGYADQPGVFVWRSHGLTSAQNGLSATFTKDGRTVDVELTHSQVNEAGLFISACMLVGEGLLTVHYQGPTSYSVMGFFTLPLTELGQQNLLVDGEVSIPYRASRPKEREVAAVPTMMKEAL